jgi:hypothetical protein
MLKKLEMDGFALAPTLVMNPVAPRYNLIVGDNGLGKSLFLDAAWWVLTGTWAGMPLMPSDPKQARLSYEFDSEKGKPVDQTIKWDQKNAIWKRQQGRPPNPGLVIYAKVDGSFSVWDPQRNYALITNAYGTTHEFPRAFHFGPKEVEEGLNESTGEHRNLCQGFIRDFEVWKLKNNPEYALLEAMANSLGEDDGAIQFSDPEYTLRGEDRAFPMVKMAYGNVSLLHLPAAMRRMVRLAYLLAWVLSSHRRECDRNHLPIARQITVLFDEPETHLHPRWQRSLLPRLHAALQNWQGATKTEVQLIAATHSPLVLASMEPHFEEAQDALWKLDLVDGVVKNERDVWRMRGDASRWLRSDVFDMKMATSKELEYAMGRAGELMRQTAPAVAQIQAMDAELQKLMSAMDPMYLNWRRHMERWLPMEAE